MRMGDAEENGPGASDGGNRRLPDGLSGSAGRIPHVMKTSSLLLILAAGLVSGPAVAQNASPPATQVQPTVRPTNVVEDGLVFYRGQTFLIRNGRAAAVDSTLLAEGEILTPQGRKVPMPRDLGINPKPTIKDGLFTVNGDTYLLREGTVTRVDAGVRGPSPRGRGSRHRDACGRRADP